MNEQTNLGVQMPPVAPVPNPIEAPIPTIQAAPPVEPAGQTVLTENNDSSMLDVLDSNQPVQDVQNIDVSIPFMDKGEEPAVAPVAAPVVETPAVSAPVVNTPAVEMPAPSVQPQEAAPVQINSPAEIPEVKPQEQTPNNAGVMSIPEDDKAAGSYLDSMPSVEDQKKMFGKIKNINDVTAIVEIHKENMVVPNLMNLHVVFETKEGKKILGEVKTLDGDDAHINLLGQFVDNNRFIAGTIIKPTLDSTIRIIQPEEMDIVFGKNDPGSIYLGKSAIYAGKDVYIDINDMFSNHMAIFGNTGSGKSCSVARIVQNIFLNKNFLPFNANLFFFDAYGEYKNAFKVLNQLNPNYQYKFITSNPIDDTDVMLRIPVYHLTVDDMCLVLQADNHHQYTIVERTLKLAKLFSRDDENTRKLKNHLIAKAIMAVLFSNQQANGKKNDIFTILKDCSTPEFNVDTDIQGIGYVRKFSECFGIDRNGEFGESVLINEYLLKYIDDELEMHMEVPKDAFYTLDDLEKALSFCLIGDGFLGNKIMQDNSTILQVRLHSLNNSSNRKFFDVPNYISMENFISSLIVHNGKRSQIVNINLEDIDDQLAKTIVKIFCKMIFDFAKSREDRAQIPFNLFIEEAHRYVQKNDIDLFLLGYNIFERIAKEGRKYGVMLDLISQRPVELSDTVIGQTSNFCILKMTHPLDLDYINKMLPNISGDVIDKLTSLQSGTMVTFGTAFKIPVIVKMDMPNPAPYSSNCDVTARWKA
ncbi:MAG: DUF87 domain-containing protein [Bacilli bacterium]|nr:DUF87 domain-containing protein [Bacilli bacterium]